MREDIPRTPAIQVLEGDAGVIMAGPSWQTLGPGLLAIQHIPGLEVAAHEIRRVLRPGAPVLIRGGIAEHPRRFPETRRMVDTFPGPHGVPAEAFAAAGFRREALEQVRQTYPASLADYLGEVDAPPRRCAAFPRRNCARQGASSPRRWVLRERGSQEQLARTAGLALDRLELLERLAAAVAEERAARRRAEDVLEPILRRAAGEGTAEGVRFQPDQLRRGRCSWRRRREPRLAELLRGWPA